MGSATSTRGKPVCAGSWAFSRNAQALLRGFGCWLSSRCPDFVLVCWGGRNPSSVASGSPFLWLSSLTCCFSLAASASSARAVGGVGGARAMVGRAVLSVKPCHVEAAASVSHLQSPMECSSITAGSVVCSPDPPKPDLSPQFPGCEALVRSVWPGDHP